MKVQDLLKQRRTHRAERYADPGIVAYYWNGGPPKQNPVRNISLSGAYVCTEEKWCVGTIIWIVLETYNGSGSKVASVTVPCRVVWDGPDGFGVNFVFTANSKRKALDQFIHQAVADRPEEGVQS